MARKPNAAEYAAKLRRWASDIEAKPEGETPKECQRIAREVVKKAVDVGEVVVDAARRKMLPPEAAEFVWKAWRDRLPADANQHAAFLILSQHWLAADDPRLGRLWRTPRRYREAYAESMRGIADALVAGKGKQKGTQRGRPSMEPEHEKWLTEYKAGLRDAKWANPSQYARKCKKKRSDGKPYDESAIRKVINGLLKKPSKKRKQVARSN